MQTYFLYTSWINNNSRSTLLGYIKRHFCCLYLISPAQEFSHCPSPSLFSSAARSLASFDLPMTPFATPCSFPLTTSEDLSFSPFVDEFDPGRKLLVLTREDCCPDKFSFVILMSRNCLGIIAKLSILSSSVKLGLSENNWSDDSYRNFLHKRQLWKSLLSKLIFETDDSEVISLKINITLPKKNEWIKSKYYWPAEITIYFCFLKDLNEKGRTVFASELEKKMRQYKICFLLRNLNGFYQEILITADWNNQ